ncbi:4Fe-4S binding protein, partial [Dissulfurispira sp.]|uniref:4Fe-4S binding protein n=1 Tax=Dissulfurispira sp. TaxID=2817609 RepID=UPI002FD9960C
GLRLSKLRRLVLLGIIILFLLQFVKIKVLVGGLSGSLVVWFVKLIDIFAYFESLISSRDFTTTAFWAVLPVIAIYLIFGRAFCGWVCPMDFLFEMVDRGRAAVQKSSRSAVKISPKLGYAIAGVLLGISALIEIPFFTNYLSHLTNFFRLLTGSVFFAFKLPVEPVVLAYSGGMITLLLGLEYFFPRLWCRVLCPVGKTYGLFNKVSFLKLKFMEGECGECNLCDQMCYMNVKIAKNIDQPGLRDTNCIYCGRCVEGCETKGKLIKMKF